MKKEYHDKWMIEKAEIELKLGRQREVQAAENKRLSEQVEANKRILKDQREKEKLMKHIDEVDKPTVAYSLNTVYQEMIDTRDYTKFKKLHNHAGVFSVEG